MSSVVKIIGINLEWHVVYISKFSEDRFLIHNYNFDVNSNAISGMRHYGNSSLTLICQFWKLLTDIFAVFYFAPHR